MPNGVTETNSSTFGFIERPFLRAPGDSGAPFEFQQPFLRRSRALLITAPLGQRASRVCWKENRGTVTERS